MAGVLLVTSIAVKAEADDHPQQVRICILPAATLLYIHPDKNGEPARVEHALRVEARNHLTGTISILAEDGRRGFVDEGPWLETCSLKSAESPMEAPSVAPKLDALDLTKGAVALETIAAAAQGAEVPADLIDAQSDVIGKLREARQEQQDVAEHPDTNRALIRVAVYDFTLTNIAEVLGRVTSDALLQEVRKIEGVSAIGMDEVREMLDFEAQRQALGCDADDQCLAEIAGALGVDEIIVGSLLESADGRSMSIKRIDQRRASVRESVNHRFVAGSGEEFLIKLGDSVESLFPQRRPRPGAIRGVSQKLLLRANPPPVDRWTTLGVAAGGIGAAILGGGFGLAATHFETLHNQAQSSDAALDAATYRHWESQGQSYARYANGAYLSSALLFCGAAVMSFFTDWASDEEEKGISKP